MNRKELNETALWYVPQQFELAEMLTLELHRLGIPVFRHDFDFPDLRAWEGDQELQRGTKHAKVIVLFYSENFFKVVYDTNDRHSLIGGYQERNNAKILLLRLDDTPIPHELPASHDLRSLDSKNIMATFKNIAKKISEYFVDSSISRQEISKKTNPWLTSLMGSALWENYQYERVSIGRNKLKFTTQWGKSDEATICANTHGLPQAKLALARGYTSITQLVNARLLDYKDNLPALRQNDIVVLRNEHNAFAAVQILGLQPIEPGNPADRLRLKYCINPDGSDNFNHRMRVHSLRIQGFRSHKNLGLCQLKPLTAFIGTNGCGKSDILKLFEMVSQMLKNQKLEHYIDYHGGADLQLFDGRNTTNQIKVEFEFSLGLEDYYDYRFSLTAATFDKFEVTNEEIRLRTKDKKTAEWIRVVNPEKKTETGLHRLAYGSSDNYLQSRIAENIINILGHTQVYRFNNILEGSSFNQSSEIDADLHLAGDGRNLTQVLFQLSKRHAERYRYICELIQRILPEFKQFEFQERNGLMSLYWKAIHLKKSINAKATSGSSLRMFALVTLLNIPFDHLPSILLIDEPELGLHPDGIALIAAMIKSRSINKQFSSPPNLRFSLMFSTLITL